MAWTTPYTKSDKSALVPSGPWSYGMEAIAAHATFSEFEYLLPENFESDGEGYVYFAEIISKSPNFPELNYEAPGLVQYREFAIFLKVKAFGREYAYCPFMYVDNDVSLLRGFVAGFPKKMAVIDITKKHPLLKQEKLGGVAMRAGYSLAKLVVEPEDKTDSNPLDKFGSWILYRFAEPMGVREFIEITPAVEYAEIEKGRAELSFAGGINDELHLKVKEVLGGYSFSALLKIAEMKKIQ
jgi:hypothetical protein